ncbi:MAG: hypothetical protein B7733_21535 [Myxococcales bacterium FL481]|nr:MAG: hypothetical protein B7733_21535 [Myxococcales bacterium FL481]
MSSAPPSRAPTTSSPPRKWLGRVLIAATSVVAAGGLVLIYQLARAPSWSPSSNDSVPTTRTSAPRPPVVDVVGQRRWVQPAAPPAVDLAPPQPASEARQPEGPRDTAAKLESPQASAMALDPQDLADIPELDASGRAKISRIDRQWMDEELEQVPQIEGLPR